MQVGVDWLPHTAFLFVVVFARLGAMIMLLPALGERVIPTRLRLTFALMFTLILVPVVAEQLPAMPDTMPGAIAIVFHEIAVGLILGGLARLIVSATEVAGATIAFQMGLSMAQTANPMAEGVQGAIVGSFLSFLAMALIFALDLHHLVLGAVYNSYAVIPTNAALMLDDAAFMAVDTVARAFAIGVQMAAPFIVFGLVFYLGLGLLSKLMPQLQVFFIAMPANISIGLILLMLLLGMMMTWYITHFENQIIVLSGQG